LKQINQRREFLKLAGGAAALLSLSRYAHGENCMVTPEQTRGPFVPDDFPFTVDPQGHPYVISADRDADLTRISAGSPAKGQQVILRGQIVDENCRAVPNSTVYLWQADERGHYNNTEDSNVNTVKNPLDALDPNFQYRGVVTTDARGNFQFRTVKPKYYPLDPAQPDFKRTAHLHIAVVAPGFQPLITQGYFEGDLLDDIDEIRRLNKIDILLGLWRDRQPVGRVDPRFLPLIVEYKDVRGMDALTGDLTLSLMRA
jgi:protocatechuate 3,4-dioxygenase beta subunit